MIEVAKKFVDESLEIVVANLGNKELKIDEY